MIGDLFIAESHDDRGCTTKVTAHGDRDEAIAAMGRGRLVHWRREAIDYSHPRDGWEIKGREVL